MKMEISIGVKIMPIMKNREYRNMVEIRAAEAANPDIENETEEQTEERKIVEGYATVFDSPYVLFRDDDVVFSEVIAPNAFDETDMSDVIMQYNHEGRVFARISNETLTVNPDEHGLFVSADLGGTEIGRGLYEEIKGGYTDKMSFGFVVGDDEYSEMEAGDDGMYYVLRTIKSISKLYDVSAVSIPANDATEISVRELSDGVIEKVKSERTKAAELELAKRRLEIRAKALMER